MSAGKPKPLLKHIKGKKKKEQILNDADDYLAAAIDDEEAMGKHRGGDAPKSLRFARKALDLYEQGLNKYPRNFDLAYNKARLELEIATHPVLVKVLDISVIDLLRQSLSSHHYAITIEPDNADTLFNTAQVLTAIAELVAKDDDHSDAEALQYLEKALEYQARCLQVQEVKYAESRRMQEEAMRQNGDSEDEDGGTQIDSKTTTAFEDREEEEQWVRVVEPVTANTLVDTILAQLSTLTTLCSIVTSSLTSIPGSKPVVSLSWIESYSTKLVGDALPSVMRTHSQDLFQRGAEVALTKAVFAGSFLELAFRSGAIDAEIYNKELVTAFSTSELDTNSSPEALLASSRAFIALSNALADHVHRQNGVDLGTSSNMRWNVLSRVQKLLLTAASLNTTKSDTEVLATTHFLRGDTSLLLFVLSYPPASFEQAITNSAQLLKNAEVFYRNAMKLYASLGKDSQEEKQIAEFRGGVVSVLQISNRAASNTVEVGMEAILREASIARSDDWRREQLQDMIDEGLVGGEAFGFH